MEQNPYPKDADCQVVIDQLFASNDQLVVAQNGCLTFTYQTCEGFFCALCSTLSTNTYFIGNQLSSAESLCVSQNQAGTIVGQDAPQASPPLPSSEPLPTHPRFSCSLFFSTDDVVVQMERGVA